MSNVTLDGEVQLSADGVMQGWCWNSSNPDHRLSLEILIDDRVVATFTASRFREDLRSRNIGDGYYGFIATIAKSLRDAGENFVISACDRASGRVFWRQVRGDTALSSDFAARVAQVREVFARVSWAERRRVRANPTLVSGFSSDLFALGNHLQAATGLRTRKPVAAARAAALRAVTPFVLDASGKYNMTVVVVADSSCEDALAAISAVSSALNIANASLLLIDRGAKTEVALAASVFTNLRYIRAQSDGLRSLLSDALQYAPGEQLIFLRNPRASVALALGEIGTHLRGSNAVFINSRSMRAACQICSLAPESIPKRRAAFPLGLEFAATREVLEQFRDIPPVQIRAAGHEEFQIAAQALRNGIDVCLWDEPNVAERSTPGVEAT